MEHQAAIPPTLPRPNPTVSYWQDPPDEIANLRVTSQLPEKADVVIIGSGITGASIAYNLLEQDSKLSIVLLEARQACSGATGRNGGHTKGGTYRSFLSNVKTLGVDEAVKTVRFEYDTIKAVHAFAKLHGIDCDLWSGDTVDVVYDQEAWDRAVESIELMRKLMPGDLERSAKYTFHTAAETQEKFHCKGEVPVGAISYEAGSLSAYKFVVGLLKLCIAKGLNLQTNMPVNGLTKRDDGWDVQTGDGKILAERVVLATNGYTGYLFPPLRSVIVPLRGHITAHRPGSKMPVLQTTYSFIYAKGYDYMISRPPGTTHSGDIVIGGGLSYATKDGLYEYGTTDDQTTDPDVIRYLTSTTSSFFGETWGEDDTDGRIRRQWSGIMGYSPDGFPLVGEMPDNPGLYISASFQGHGMVLCFLCARALAKIMDRRPRNDTQPAGKTNHEGNDEEDLDKWFPKAFKITNERMRKRFQGRLHT